jgi:hypothetical protein
MYIQFEIEWKQPAIASYRAKPGDNPPPRHKPRSSRRKDALPFCQPPAHVGIGFPAQGWNGILAGSGVGLHGIEVSDLLPGSPYPRVFPGHTNFQMLTNEVVGQV